MSGLQQAKDKEIAALKADNEKISADLGESTQALEAKTAELASAEERIQQLASEAEKTAKELSETKAALAKEQERYREQVGRALQMPADALKNLHGRELALAALKARS